MTNNQIALLITAAGFLLGSHLGVGGTLAFVIGVLFFAAIQEDDS
jgi:hypothetical protein